MKLESYLHLIQKRVACVAGGFVREGLKVHFHQNCQLSTTGWKMNRLKNLYAEECKTAFGWNNQNSKVTILLTAMVYPEVIIKLNQTLIIIYCNKLVVVE